MEIIDAQIHPPAPRLGGWDESGGEEEYRLSTELALASMEAAGVDRAVISWDVGWPEFAATHFPDKFVSTVGRHYGDHAWLEAPDFEEQFEEFVSKPGVVGYRQLLNHPDKDAQQLKSGGFDRLFETCQKLEIPLLIMVSGEPSLAAPIAQKYPNLQLVLDHLAMLQPPYQTPDNPPWKALPELLELAQHENIALKLVGAPTLSAEPYPFRDLWAPLNQIVESFGPERLMWGTDIQGVIGRIAHYTTDVDYPGLHNYGEAVGYLRDTDQLSQSEKEMIFAGTARRVFNWPT
ncbi:amidohydrolase family protein [Arthrobacter sp. Cr_A7]|uniref:amidohydrolase family protein n=1 Tax=Arthrobacter sp. Cr_A7 TaxID=3031017 RepID=UPI0023DA7985|nr:amidohydrolase family protein [Arthrobacter sp. Cr_A7]MDF2050417.1 amidohydrolase family protein [Arthrobacter sp. Cr_A7]